MKYVNKTVLVVDDEPDIQEILKVYLERVDGVEVVQALTGERGVETYREMTRQGDAPAMVIIDLNLSGSNADQEIVEAHRRGEDERLDGVRTAKEIFVMDDNAVIWGYTAWANTSWAEGLRDAGAQKIVDRVVPFKDFVGMVADDLQD